MYKQSLKNLELTEVIKEADTFFLNKIKACLSTLLVLPCSTNNNERSFGTLRREKTFLRITLSDDRNYGLCVISIHRKLVNEKTTMFI